MADKDHLLGRSISGRLQALGAETPMITPVGPSMISPAFGSIMTSLGLDLKDESLSGTPDRVSKMYRDELFYGLNYANFPKCSTFENNGQYDELLFTECTVQSFCEHHFLPIIGKAWVAYIPGKRILGLSKFNRVVDFFCRRPQVQERLTVQIAEAFKLILGTDDVAVVIKAEHHCVKLRGVRDACNETYTSRLGGKFREVPELRAEFTALARI